MGEKMNTSEDLEEWNTVRKHWVWAITSEQRLVFQLNSAVALNQSEALSQLAAGQH